MKRSIISLSITSIIITVISMVSLQTSSATEKFVADTATKSLEQAAIVENSAVHNLFVDEFSEAVTSVDLEKSTITLESGAVIQISSSVINEESDFASLQEVSDALSNGTSVTAEGSATLSQTEDGGEIYIAESVTFTQS